MTRGKCDGGDDWFNMHLATRRLSIEIWKVLVPLLTPIVERVNRWATK